MKWIKWGKESQGPEVETEIRGVVGVVNEIVIYKVGEKAVAVNVDIYQGLKHQNKKKGRTKLHTVDCYNFWSTE